MSMDQERFIAALVEAQERVASVRAPPPRKFSGKASEIEPFLNSLHRKFLKPYWRTVAEKGKIEYAIKLFEGEAAEWLDCAWRQEADRFCNFADFEKSIRLNFGGANEARDASAKLLALRQGSGSCQTYWRRFQILAGSAGYRRSDKPLVDIFLHGLCPSLRRALAASPDLPEDLEELARVACKVDSQTSLCYPDHAADQDGKEPATTPIEIDAVTQQARQVRRPETRRCFACGKVGHLKAQCRSLNKRSICVGLGEVGGAGHPVFKQTVRVAGRSAALVDSGATRCCVSACVATRWRLPLRKLPESVVIRFGNSRQIEVTQETEPLSLEICPGGQCEKFSFLVVPDLSHEVILGLSWFKRAQPVIDWPNLRVVSVS